MSLSPAISFTGSRLTGGIDLSQIDSIGPQAALHLIREIGTDMTNSHFQLSRAFGGIWYKDMLTLSVRYRT